MARSIFNRQTLTTHRTDIKDESRYASQMQVGGLNEAIVMIELKAWEVSQSATLRDI